MGKFILRVASGLCGFPKLRKNAQNSCLCDLEFEQSFETYLLSKSTNF